MRPTTPVPLGYVRESSRGRAESSVAAPDHGSRQGHTAGVPDPPADVEAFIRDAPSAAQSTLRDLRRQILALLGEASERISYRVPVFVVGRQVVGMGYSKTHVSLYSMSPSLMADLAPSLREAGVKVTGATAAVPHGETFPPEAVRAIVRGRMAETGIG